MEQRSTKKSLFEIPIPEFPDIDFKFVPCDIPLADIKLPPLVMGTPAMGDGKLETDWRVRLGVLADKARAEKIKNLQSGPFSTNEKWITGDDVLYISNAHCSPGSLRLHLTGGGYLELTGTPDEIADKINKMFVRGRNAS